MIRTFLFDEEKSQWLEEERILLAHDICTILDEDNEIIYFWSGPKSNKIKFRKGYKHVRDLISNFSNLNLQLIMTEKNFPLDIQNKVDKMFKGFAKVITGYMELLVVNVEC